MFTIPPESISSGRPAEGGPAPELDDGVEVTLEVGDTVVQNGTRHRWRNPGTEPCHLAVFLVGAHHTRFGT